MKPGLLGILALLLVLCVPAARGEGKSATIEHRVEPGETLWSIAAQSDVYADPYLWPLIYKFNRDQITDPSMIYPSQLLQIPVNVDEPTRRAARVQAGDAR